MSMLRTGIYIIAALSLTRVNAQPVDADSIPKLLRHSQIKTSIMQGDKIKLSVEAEGEKLLYRWVRNYKTICREAECEFDSSVWGFGKQNLVVVAYNRFGSQSIEFVIKVLAREPGEEMKTVEPPMVKAKEVETLKQDDFYVKSLKGIGYSYHKRRVKVIAKLPRPLEWNEKIKAHVKGVIRLGRKSKEEHAFMPGSVASLFTHESGKRGIRLIRGAIHSRQLSEEQPGWSLLFSDWLQIDGDEKADIVLENVGSEEKPKVEVTVLRGYARVFYRKVADDGETLEHEGASVLMPAGTFMTFKPGQAGEVLRSPKNRKILKIMLYTTPQYFIRGMKKKTRGEYLIAERAPLAKKSIEVSLENAKKAMAKRDYILALEHLLPLAKKGSKNFAHRMAIGRAYRGLGVYRIAHKFYRQARGLDTENPDTFFESGLMYIDSRAWKRALKNFEQAEDLDYKDSQALNYYLGVAKTNIGETRSAQHNFFYSLIEPKDEDIKRSAEEFMISYDHNKLFGAIGKLGFGMDSNVYRISESIERSDDFIPVSGNFYEGSAEIYLNAYKGFDGFLRFQFDILKRGYLDSKLKDVEILEQRLHADWLLLIGGDRDNKATFKLYAEPFVHLISFGEERSDDVIGANFEIGTPFLWGSPDLTLDYGGHIDPLPGRNDKLDPVTREAVAPSDRSGTSTYYGLQLTLYEQKPLNVLFDFDMGGMTYKDSLVSKESFSDTQIVIKTDYEITYYLDSFFHLGYLMRDFSKSDDARKDSRFWTDLGLMYFWNPSFHNDLVINYMNQSSNSEIYKYSRYEAILYLTLEI